MDESAKYLIHANIAAAGVVERSDVVGAVFGQTEGLLGDELDLRDLQESSKVGRIDVEIDSENGQSFGEVTVASSLDKVETAILAASLETIDRIGPCRASVEVTSLEDVRAAKRRHVVDRAKELLDEGFDDTSLTGRDIREEVRDSARVADVSEYEGYPAGPAVVDSDAVIVVEGRADVIQLLDHGIKNAVAVEGTSVPDPIAELTRRRTATTFLDGDRGGELILKELAQVGDVDYVAFAPAGKSVEDLDRDAVLDGLREKVPYDQLGAESDLREAAENQSTETLTSESASPSSSAVDAVRAADTGSLDTVDLPSPNDDTDNEDSDHEDTDHEDTDHERDDPDESDTGPVEAETTDDTAASDVGQKAEETKSESNDGAADADPVTGRSLTDHVSDVIDDRTGGARLLDADGVDLRDVSAAEAFDAVAEADPVPHTVVLDGEVDQRLLDVAAQRGVVQLVGRTTGDFVKKPVDTHVLTADDLRIEAPR